MRFFAGNFRELRPAHVKRQAETFDWLVAAHARAEQTRARDQHRLFQPDEFARGVATALARFGCGADKIATRGLEIEDCNHTRWHEMEVYRLLERPEGLGAHTRSLAFARAALRALDSLLPTADPPDDLLHVTCTGYAAPSAAQRLIAARNWQRTRVLHAYHMGCYAAFPALRTAAALVLARDVGGAPQSARADIAHTEICSLHVNPLLHEPEQLVVQSLFADGFISYSVWHERPAGVGPLLQFSNVEEWVAPDSADAMTWIAADWGMQMGLSRDVPLRLARSLRPFIERLRNGAALAADESAAAVYAVHPGGPKILDHVEAALELEPEQLAQSRRVLRDCGNMSSATLPHVWQALVRDDSVAPGRAIISLAFGPGLTLCGAVARKVQS